MNSVKLQDTRLIYRNMLLILYTNNELQRMKQFRIGLKVIKCLEINLTNDMTIVVNIQNIYIALTTYYKNTI